MQPAEDTATPKPIVVTNPFTNLTVGRVKTTELDELQVIEQRMKQAAATMGALTKHARTEILNAAADRVQDDQRAYAELITAESGKPIAQARNEVRRCINTLRMSAAAASDLHGETIPFDAYASGRERMGYFTREPLGNILAITPFNDPLNLVAHKLGPAIAAGNAVVLKPAERTPLSAARLVADLGHAGLPAHGVTLVQGDACVVGPLLRMDFRMVSFTGGFHAAEAIMAQAGVKRFSMDLGGNAGVIVMDDADLALAVSGCVDGAFGAAGQNCIGVQRILLHKDIATEFEAQMIAQTEALVVGDPANERTDLGPMIGEAEAERAEQWTQQAIADSATLLTGGKRDGAVFWPTVLKNVPRHTKVWCQEVFAPIVSLVTFETFEEAIALSNDTDVSLHTGIYTNQLDQALEAAKSLEAAAVMINETSDYRFDGMPFGGYKKGSVGREGVRFAIEEMSQTKTVCFNR